MSRKHKKAQSILKTLKSIERKIKSKAAREDFRATQGDLDHVGKILDAINKYVANYC